MVVYLVYAGCRTEGIQRLESICAQLPDGGAVRDLFVLLSAGGDESISTFELLTSGVLHSLCDYLEGKDLRVLESTEENEQERQWQVLTRLGEFANVALPLGSGGSPPMLALLSKLQDTLAATEKLPVRITSVSAPPSLGSFFPGSFYASRLGLSRSAGAGSSSLTAGLSALSNPFKIRLTRSSGETQLRDYGSNVVLIEPLASLKQVEDFLWPRVQMSDRDENAEGSTDAARVASEAVAAATAARRSGRGTATGDGSARSAQTRGREPSRGRPIPQPTRRLTRAQARALAEAEVAGFEPNGNGSRDEETAEDVHMSEDDIGIDPLSLVDSHPAEGSLPGHIESAHDDDEEYDEDEDMDEEYLEDDFDEGRAVWILMTNYSSFVEQKGLQFDDAAYTPFLFLFIKEF